jgi:hypothetical protein
MKVGAAGGTLLAPAEWNQYLFEGGPAFPADQRADHVSVIPAGVIRLFMRLNLGSMPHNMANAAVAPIIRMIR